MQLFTDEVLEKMDEILKAETETSNKDNSESAILGDQYYYAWNSLEKWLKGMDSESK